MIIAIETVTSLFTSPEPSSYIEAMLLKGGQALLVFVIGWIIISLLLGGFGRLMQKRVPDAILRAFLISVCGIAARTLLFISCLDMLDVSVTSIITALGAVGLALGLAMQDSLGNLAQGVVLLFTRPFQITDFVEIDGMAGTVEDMDLLRITLATPDRKRIYISNSQAAKGKIINYTAFKERRLEIVAEVAVSEDLAKVRQVLGELFAAHPQVLKEPEPTVYLSVLGSDTVQVIGRLWVESKLYWQVYYQLLEQAGAAFAAAGIACPEGKQLLRMETNQLPL
ncbi:MAG: mechanosensitive ion channel [Symbiobacteriaceae bacterium]|nr:mechanosensitive ion channel [Symbiobacteriaceae bacterium]